MSQPQPFRVARLVVSAALAVVLSPSVLPAQAPASSQSPTEVFLAYRKALAEAKSYDTILSFMEAKGRGMVEGMPEPTRSGMFELLKKFEATYSDVAVAGEEMKGDAAVLSLTGKDPKGQPAKGTVPMTKEASGWKVGMEKWSSRPR